MQGAPLEIHLEIVRHLRLRDFKAFRRTCAEFSKVVTRDYRRYRSECATLANSEQTLTSSSVWRQLRRCKTAKEFVDYLDECEDATDRFRLMEDVHSRAIRACVKFKLWDTLCDLDIWKKTTLCIGGKKLMLEQESDSNGVRVATLDGIKIYDNYGGIPLWTPREDGLVERVTREIICTAYRKRR